jgi:hypothetical protein
MVDLPQVVNYGHGEIFTPILTNLMSYHFSLFLNFSPLYIFFIYSMNLKKDLQDFDGLNVFCSLRHIGTLMKNFVHLLV